MRLGHVSTATLVILAALVGASSIGISHASSFGQPYQVFTSTVTLGSSVSSSLSQTRVIYNGAFTVLSTTGTSLPCEFVTENFTAMTGQYVSGNVTSDNPIAIYVVQESSYVNWVKTGSCGNVVDAIASQVITTSYSFNAIVPNSGNWTIALVNSSNAKNADGFLSAYISSGSSTTTQLFMSTFTSTLPEVLTTSTSSQPTGVPGFPVASIILGVAVGFAAIILLRRRARVDSR